jgi:hypothetical protein
MWIVELLVENLAEVLAWLTSTIGLFSMIAVATPNKTDDAILGWVFKVVNFVGMNWGNATNK